MNGRRPSFKESLLVALGLALAAAAFLLAMVGKPTLGARLAAIGLILLVLVLVAVWHWGYREGEKGD